MPAPVTAILDTFTRADGAVGSNYTITPAGGSTSLGPQVSSNQCVAGSEYWGIVWNVATYGPDSEFYLTFVSGLSSAEGFALFIRLTGTDPFGSSSGYTISVVPNATTANVFIQRIDGSVFTQLGAAADLSLSNGDVVSAQAIGSDIALWRSNALVASRTDSTYPSAGYVGAYLASAGEAMVFDNFGGGTIRYYLLVKD